MIIRYDFSTALPQYIAENLLPEFAFAGSPMWKILP